MLRAAFLLGAYLVVLVCNSAHGGPPVLPEHRSQAGDRQALANPLPEGAPARFGSARARPAEAVSAVAFSPDGKLLASAHLDRHFRLWEVATGRELRRFRGPDHLVTILNFSPNGNRLLAAGDSAALWDVATGKQSQKLNARGQ